MFFLNQSTQQTPADFLKPVSEEPTALEAFACSSNNSSFLFCVIAVSNALLFKGTSKEKEEPEFEFTPFLPRWCDHVTQDFFSFYISLSY